MNQILETKTINGKLFWENEKPKLNLTSLERTSVELETQKEFDELMHVYEAGEWKWSSRELPTHYNYWTNKEKIYIDAGISHFRDLKGFFEYHYEEFHNCDAISIEKFYEMQGIIKEDLSELNKWFDKNKPDRASKGK